jgi:cell wall-associated NlpC family hydrolase
MKETGWTPARRRTAVVVLILSLTACSPGATDSTTGANGTTTTEPGQTSSSAQGADSTTSTSVTSTSTTNPTSTTTAATSSTTAATATTLAGVPSGTIGAIGCSVTSDAVVGYFEVGGTRFWNIRGDYGGASVGMWARGVGGAWASFDENLASYPGTNVLWWQLCTLNGSPRDGLDAAVMVLDQLRARMPGVTIYVSGQPEYEPAGICDISGPTGPAFMAQVAADLVSQQGLLAGPVTGPLAESDTIGGCHASSSGQVLMGEQLLAAFG